jgi:magnesium transporter
MVDERQEDGEESLETAAFHMVTGIPKATADLPVAVVVEELRGHLFDCADCIFVTDGDGRFTGIVRINDLLAAAPEEEIGDIVEERHGTAQLDDDQEHIALLAMEKDMIAVPVLDGAGRLVGAVPPDALLDILRHEHMEDLQRLAGIQRHTDGAAQSLEAPIHDRVRRRLPWLVVGLVASTAATGVVALFEETLNAKVTIAFFVPALVYIAGAIGTQAVSVAVRALSVVEVGLVRLVRDELIIGLTIGLAMGVLSALPVYLIFGDAPLAVALGLAVLGAGTVSAVVGFGLPWAFQRFGFDPALGSGPVCTIIQDVASLAIYFMLVTAIVI